MKFKTVIILILSATLLLCCCSFTPTDTSISFYYRQSKLDYDSPQGALGAESRRDLPDRLAYTQIFNKYLEGPRSSNLESPFPSDLKLIDLTIDQQTAHITLSSSLSGLTGADLTICCVCIAMTVKNITGCAVVQIKAQDAMLENREAIIIDTNTIQISDLTP